MGKIDNQSGFKIPEGYFDNIPDRILQKTGASSPEKQNEGFKVPAGYFDQLETRILEKIDPEKDKVVVLHPFKKYYYAVAAVAALLIVFFGLKLPSNQKITFSFDDLSFTDIESYFETNELDFTSFEIAEMIPVHDLEINDVLTNGLQEENIIDYLNNATDTFDELYIENND